MPSMPVPPSTRTSRTGRYGLACAALLLLSLSLRAEETLVYESYFMIKMHGQVTGRMHYKLRKVTEHGQPARYVSTDEQKTSIRRGNDITSTEESSIVTEDENGRPLSVEHTAKQSKELTIRKAAVKDGEIEMAITAAGETRNLKVPYKGAFLFPFAENKLRKEKGFQPGTEYSYQIFLVELGEVKEAKVKVLPPEKLALAGGEAKDWHVLQLTGIAPGLTVTCWCGDDGFWRKLTVDVNDQEIVACSKEEWEKPLDPPKIDAMKKNSVDPGFLMPAPVRQEEVTYRLKLEKGEIGAVGWADERQQIVEKPDPQSIILHVKRVGMKDEESPTLPLPAADLEKHKACMLSAPMIQWDDPEIVKTAKEVAGDEKNALKVVRKLERFVFENIKGKSYDTGFASAKEVQKNRAGDCTEHAVWLAALLRACGIPSKVSMGLTFAEGSYNYHMWTEAWLGRWVAFDATLCGQSVDPAHVEMADSPLEGASMGDKALAVAQVFGRMQMQVEKAVLAGGKTVTAAELKTPGKLDNNKFLDPVLGVAFDVPAGMQLIPRGSKLPNGADLPRPVVGVLVDRARGIQMVVVNLATPPAADLPAAIKMPDAKIQDVKGGKATLLSSGPMKAVMALAPGCLFRIEIAGRNPADTAAAADGVLKSLQLGE